MKIFVAVIGLVVVLTIADEFNEHRKVVAERAHKAFVADSLRKHEERQAKLAANRAAAEARLKPITPGPHLGAKKMRSPSTSQVDAMYCAPRKVWRPPQDGEPGFYYTAPRPDDCPPERPDGEPVNSRPTPNTRPIHDGVTPRRSRTRDPSATKQRQSRPCWRIGSSRCATKRPR